MVSMLSRRRRLSNVLATITWALSAAGCDEEPERTSDVLDDASVIRCDMPADGACREYRRVRRGDFDAFVDVSGARSVCSSGWPEGSGQAGIFAEGECPIEAALARCQVDLGYLAVDVFYEGFLDTETERDPIGSLNEACESAGGSFEQAPFP